MEDYEIVKLYLDKNEEAIKQSSIKYDNYCFMIANNILHSQEDSKECLNDTYLAAWNAIPPSIPNCLKTFLGKITRRLSINKFKSLSAEKRGGGEYILSLNELEECFGRNDVEDNIALEELTELINDYLGYIDTLDRKIFICRYFYFESIKEISLRFMISQSRVKMSLKRTRDSLKEYLIKEGVNV